MTPAEQQIADLEDKNAQLRQRVRVMADALKPFADIGRITPFVFLDPDGWFERVRHAATVYYGRQAKPRERRAI